MTQSGHWPGLGLPLMGSGCGSGQPKWKREGLTYLRLSSPSNMLLYGEGPHSQYSLPVAAVVPRRDGCYPRCVDRRGRRSWRGEAAKKMQPSKIFPLTSLRFFAAFAIVVHHSRGAFLDVDFVDSIPFDQGVSLFFVLSGFILLYKYPSLPSWAVVRSFWIARFARIWPLHALTMVAAIPLALPVLASPDAAVLNLALLHGWVPSYVYYFSFNAVSWSISTEVGFYALFPLLVVNFERTWWWKLLGSAMLLVTLIVLCQWLAVPPFSLENHGISSHGLLDINPLARLFEFVLGMTIALAWRFRPALGDGVLLWTIAELVVLILVAWSVMRGTGLLYDYIKLSPLPVASEWSVFGSSCIAFGLMIFVFASGTGLISRALSIAPLVFLGEASYALYLVHQLMISAYVTNYGTAIGWLSFSAFTGAVILVSSIAYLAVERPARSAIKKWAAARTRLGYPQQSPAGIV